MAFIGPNNALAWAHFRLRGGWKRSLTFSGCAAALLTVLIVGGFRVDPINKARILYGWTTGLLSLEAACLLIYVPGRITASIRQDIQSKLIESHRLMPTPAAEAVAGYITGAAMQPLIFCGVIFLIGACTGAGASIDLSRWVFTHMVLLVFCAFIWVLSAYASFGARFGPALLFMPLFVAPYMSGGGGFSLVPALMVLLSPIVGNTIFDMRTAGFNLPPTYAVAFLFQIYFGWLCMTAAARRYRSADAIGMNTILGLLLVAGWTGMTVIALRQWEEYRPRGWPNSLEASAQVQVLASMLAGMLLALAPVAAVAQERVRWRRHQAANDPDPMRRPLWPPLVIAAATVTIVLIAFAPPTLARPSLKVLAETCYIIAVALTGLYCLYASMYSKYRGAGFVAFAWILFAWGGPIIADGVRYGLADDRAAEPLDVIATCSPVGAMVVIWDERPVDVRPGMAMQLLINGIPMVLWLTVALGQRRTLEKTAATQ